ncbi:3-ketodihydrosphingosine reductase isoform 2-T2 [Liasis olivaceus]
MLVAVLLVAATGVALVVALLLLLYLMSPLDHSKPLSLSGAHVVVTGGSSGIGKSIAIECFKQGAFLTLIARNEKRLLEAKKEIEKFSVNDKQVVHSVSLDVSKDYANVEKLLKQAQEKLGPVDMLVNCAGTSINGKFEDIDTCIFEVKPYNICVTVAYPPDTDTPGFAQECQNKILETKLISEASSICQPDYVAKIIVKDAIHGKFTSSVGTDGHLLRILTNGLAPVSSIAEILESIIFLGIFRLLSLYFIAGFDNIVRRCMVEKEKTEKRD